MIDLTVNSFTAEKLIRMNEIFKLADLLEYTLDDTTELTLIHNFPEIYTKVHEEILNDYSTNNK